MTATQSSSIGTCSPVLYLAFELGWNEWKLAFATAPADSPRLRSIGARNLTTLRLEITKAKQKRNKKETKKVSGTVSTTYWRKMTCSTILKIS